MFLRSESMGYFPKPFLRHELLDCSKDIYHLKQLAGVLEDDLCYLPELESVARVRSSCRRSQRVDCQESFLSVITTRVGFSMGGLRMTFPE